MTLSYPPPFQDLRTLAEHICVPPDMIDLLIARRVLPAPIMLNGERRWRWADVREALSGRVYFLDGGDLIKIGFTKSIKQRLRSLRTTSPVPLKVLCIVKGGKAREAAFHQTFAHLRAHGEWFRAAPELREYIAALKARPAEVES